MLLEDLAEAGEVERLVVLQQDEAEVELAEGQLQVVQLADVGGHRGVPFVLEDAVAARSPAVMQPRVAGAAVVVVVVGQEVLQLRLQVGVLTVGLRQLLC